MYSGAGWIKSSLKKEMSPLGEDVANLLGRVFQGIYHLDTRALCRVDWTNDHWIQFIYYGDLATVDFDRLTALIVFAHDEMIRIDIEGCGPRYMKMMFHKRKARTGSMSERYPTIEDHIEILRRIEKAC
ncbi:hypothetical protein KA005_15550 [bacterium]|nr:hypothetical protein [bacterium]